MKVIITFSPKQKVETIHNIHLFYLDSKMKEFYHNGFDENYLKMSLAEFTLIKYQKPEKLT